LGLHGNVPVYLTLPGTGRVEGEMAHGNCRCGGYLYGKDAAVFFVKGTDTPKIPKECI
jgi:hypothetical protein